MRKPDTVTGTQLMELVQAQGYRCPLSGRVLTPETASLDHIIPLSRDGAHALSNVWIVDCEVNAAKGTLTSKEFVELCQDVTTHQSHRPEVGPPDL